MAITLDPDDRAKLRECLEQQFSLEELETLAFDLGIDSNKLLHTTAIQLSRELIGYFERRGNLNGLLTKMLSDRHDDALARLSAKLPPGSPRTKVQIIIAQNILENPSEIIVDLAAKLKIDVEQVELIGAAWGSLRLLVGLPQGAANILASSKVHDLVNGRYHVISITAFDSLDVASQEAWRLLFHNASRQPVQRNNILQSDSGSSLSERLPFAKKGGSAMSNTRLSQLITLFIVGSPVAFLFVLFVTRNPLWAILATALYSFTAFIATIVSKVMEELGVRIADQIATAIIVRLSLLLTRYQTKYLEHLIYRYRDFDTKGLTIQGEFSLELEKVYVELKLEPQTASPAETDKSIWEYLDSTAKEGIKLVVIGSPGSGKTTLLKQMTLTLAKNHRHSLFPKTLQKLPIFLTLREHAQAIHDNPSLKLPDAIQNTLVKMDREAPVGWFNAQLHKGRCVIMMDGLDEIADQIARKEIVEWVQNQMIAYPSNHFVISSRPYGYEETPLDHVRVLRIKPFTRDQVRFFIHNWYLANEITRARKDDPGVRIVAEEKAEDLIRRLGLRPALAALAINPLLVTMIATVHSSKEVLPGRRVDLYRDVFDVLLERRRSVVGLVDQPSKGQKLEVLKHLAYYMMVHELRVIPKQQALQVIRDELASTGSKMRGEDFLKNIENQSGLLIEQENDQYAFVHLTFQEYLASVHIAEDRTGKLEGELIGAIGDSWWAETIRLYAAQRDATSIIAACLQIEPPTVQSLSLAIDCANEALKIQSEIRDKYVRILDENMESDQAERRALAAEAKLSSRWRLMVRISDSVSIDNNLITNLEYQLFIDEMRARGKYHYPDHWTEDRFPPEEGKNSVVGVRPKDAVRFCEWLTLRAFWQAHYRIPIKEEVSPGDIPDTDHEAYWVSSANKIVLYSRQHLSSFQIKHDDVIKQLQNDLDILVDLRDAKKRRAEPRKPTAQLLEQVVTIGAPMTGAREKLGVPGRELELQVYFDKMFRIVFLLEEYEKCAGQLGLEFADVTQTSTSIFLEKQEDWNKFTAWLPVENYDPTELDLERFESVKNFLNSGDVVRLLDDQAKLFVNNLNRALDLLQSREWTSTTFSDPDDRKKMYAFLRWYARLCTASFAAAATRQASLHRAKGTVQRAIGTVCGSAIRDLVVLEELVQRKQKPFGGIRLVKVES
jgi:energy-coupling factor transporter ATP-binding protein EcfA2